MYLSHPYQRKKYPSRPLVNPPYHSLLSGPGNNVQENPVITVISRNLGNSRQGFPLMHPRTVIQTFQIAAFASCSWRLVKGDGYRGVSPMDGRFQPHNALAVIQQMFLRFPMRHLEGWRIVINAIDQEFYRGIFFPFFFILGNNLS